jgi:argininosuccinate lyase
VSTQKLWQKGAAAHDELSRQAEAFTVGKDKELDMLLAPYDVLGSIAHVAMLLEVGLLNEVEHRSLRDALQQIYRDIQSGKFAIRDGAEDVHSEVEFRLTEMLGETGKKVHSGRSRNDQVLLDMKMYTRASLQQITEKIYALFNILLERSEATKDILLPGYTHLQVAMVCSFGLWLGAYAESLADDMQLLRAAFTLANKNPLGSGAGYGGSLPLKRTTTTQLLGFEDLNYNVVYAQMNRGKMERSVSAALASVAATLSRLAMDATLYMSQNFGFISFPEQLTTGSSIMPHKKNPDVWELIRAKCNKIQALPNQLAFIQNNLPSGYHRDMQVLKEDYLPVFDQLSSCLDMATLMITHMQVRKDILEEATYKYLFTVEKVNELVLQGLPFREAYMQVGKTVEQGTFEKPEQIAHTHEGSLGNLCSNHIRELMEVSISSFPFAQIGLALDHLLDKK